ncbi:MAG TPA: PAS domain-containing protein [Alphaproteobacteria bacterium]|nr:PAS domain-containing protein [Alphaproteobacteria bacterium]
MDLSSVTDSRLTRALAYWREKAAGRPMPDRRDINPAEIPDLLPWILLWDVVPSGYRVRLAGTGICDAVGRELKGVDFEAMHGSGTAEIKPDYDYVVREGKPHYVERSMWWSHRSYRSYKRVLLPFTNGGDACALIMGVTSFL